MNSNSRLISTYFGFKKSVYQIMPVRTNYRAAPRISETQTTDKYVREYVPANPVTRHTPHVQSTRLVPIDVVIRLNFIIFRTMSSTKTTGPMPIVSNSIAWSTTLDKRVMIDLLDPGLMFYLMN